MARVGRVLLMTAGAAALAVLVGPFLVPVRPLKGTVPPEQLADADSRFIDVNGVKLHYKTLGSGEPALILLHGFAASTFSWREVMAPLAELGTVVAYDRPSSGLTERPLPGDWTGDSPYSPDAQVAQLIGLMDALGLSQAVLVGNSAAARLRSTPPCAILIACVRWCWWTRPSMPAAVRPPGRNRCCARRNSNTLDP